MSIRKLLSLLEGRPAREMRVPSLWDACGSGAQALESGELLVDGPSFYIEALRRVPSPSAKNEAHPDILGGGAIYSMLPRHVTAWDHGYGLENGTFLKAICILEHIKALGAKCVYLLPIFEPSGVYKKGSLGSPYAIKDFHKLDPALHDPLLGEYSEELLSLQFRAFVEAAHAYGLSVMLDFVFRTCARDNALLKAHPDWFYWIDVKHLDAFAPPRVPSLPGNTLINEKTARSLYACAETKDYIARFRQNPRDADPALFDACGGDLSKIERTFGVTTAPAFSDVLNDRQPHWSDVTYLRFDLGKNEFAKRFGAPPFVLHDTIKLDIFPAETPNYELWDILEGVMPHFIEEYDIDGARIDMGHALPKALLGRMVARAKALKPGFLLWSEVFDISRANAEKQGGFHFVTGDVWGALTKLFGNPGDKTVKSLARLLHESPLPSAAAPETPDTPRSALAYEKELEHGGVAAWKTVVLLGSVLPNVLPLWNSGIELGEVQPMNLGIGESKAGRFALERDDPDYGLLAFFDACRMRWTSNSAAMRSDHIAKCMAIRQALLPLMHGELKSRVSDDTFSFSLSHGGNTAYVYVNRAPRKRRVIIAPGRVAYRNGEFTDEPASARRVTIEPYGAIVIQA